MQKSGSKSELVMAISVVAAIGVALYGVIGYCSRCSKCRGWFCIEERTRKLVSEKNKFKESEREDADLDREEQRPGSFRRNERTYMIERTYEVTK